MDVLRENIGLLQLPYEDEYYYDEEDINEGFLGFGKKKSRWQRFKDAIKRNKGKIAAGALGLGAAAWTGRSRYNYNKALSNARAAMKNKESLGWKDDTKNQVFWKYKDNDPNQVIVSDNYGWNPLKGYGNQKLGIRFHDMSKVKD